MVTLPSSSCSKISKMTSQLGRLSRFRTACSSPSLSGAGVYSGWLSARLESPSLPCYDCQLLLLSTYTRFAPLK